MDTAITHYEKVYRTEKDHRKHYKQSVYYPIWQHVVKFVRETENPKILELGCGTGQLAHFLSDQGFKDYIGIDFSEEAIKIARGMSDQAFNIGDITDPVIWHRGYNTVIATETLEHIHDDLGMLKNIKPGTKIIFSVPTFMCEGHVRCFQRAIDITLRYFNQIYIKKIMCVYSRKNWFFGWGIIR